MDNSEKRLKILKYRLSILDGTAKSLKSSGVVRKLKRSIRNIENEMKNS